MASTQSGSAFSSYSLEISGVRTAVSEARKLIQQLRQEASKPLPKLTQSSAAVSPQAVRTTSQAALVTAKLATEQQRTAKTANDAAVSQQRLATEQQRTAATAATAEKSQLALAAAQRRAAQSTKNNGLGPALPRTIDGLSGSALTAAKAFISLQAAQKGLEFVRLGAVASDTRISFDNLAKSAHTTGDAILTSLRDAAQGTIRDSTLITAANTGILLTQGKITTELPKLVQIARASAKATGQDVGFIFDSLVRGIARGSPLIIDNAGITLNASQAFEIYAKSIGKSADQLNKQEQQQATLNAVLVAGSDIVKTVGLDANSAASNIDRAQVAVQNLGEALAAKIAPFLGGAAGGIANLLNAGSVNPGAAQEGNNVQAGLLKKASDYDSYAASIQATNDQIKESFKDDPAAGFIAEQIHGLTALNPLQFAYAQNLIQAGVAQDQALVKAQALADVTQQLGQAQQIAAQTNSAQAGEFQALIPLIGEAASTSDDAKQKVLDLSGSFFAGDINAQQFRDSLAVLVAAEEAARQAALEEAHEQRRLTQTFIEIVPAANAAASAIAAVAAAQGIAASRPKGIQDTSGLTNKQLDKVEGAFAKHLDHQNQIADGKFNLAYAKAQTDAQKIALLNSKLAKENDPVKRLQVEAQIASLQSSNAKKRAGADPNSKGLGALAQDDIKLAGSLQDQLSVVNQKLAAGNLTQHQRNQLLIEQAQLQTKIREETEKQLEAQIDSQIGLIQDRQSRRQETREIAALQRALARPNLTGERRAAVEDQLALVQLQQNRRAIGLNQQIAAAGGSLGTIPSVAPVNIPNAGVSAVSGAPVASQGPASAVANQGVTIVFDLDGQAFAKGFAPSLQDLIRNTIRATVSAG